MALITPPYHFGLVVPGIGEAQAEITAALGLTWADVQDRSVRQEWPDGPIVVEVRYTYSLQGPPYLELIEQRDGSVFEQLGLHHIGVWTDDPAEESARLAEAGWPRETVSLAPDGAWAGGLFHQGSCGLRVEVVDIGTSGPKLARYLAGGAYGSAQ